MYARAYKLEVSEYGTEMVSDGQFLRTRYPVLPFQTHKTPTSVSHKNETSQGERVLAFQHTYIHRASPYTLFLRTVAKKSHDGSVWQQCSS